MMQKIGTFISNNRRFIPLSATALLFFLAYLFGAVTYPQMQDPQIFFNLFRTSPFLLISAVGSTFVILTGGIDLSVSGLVALTTVASAALLRTGDYGPWQVILMMLVMGTLFGAVLGFFITYLKVQPFIATLAGLWIARGLCYFISDDAIPINDRIFRILGQTKILIPGLADPVTKTGDYISILVVLEFVVLAVAIYIAHGTRFGRTVYAIGGNEQSARLMGLPVNVTKTLVYTLNGFCSALAGLALVIYVSSGHGSYAKGFELTVIASVVIGGTMLTGGTGYVFGTLFGVLITGVIQTLIQFNGQLSSWWTNILVGVLTLVFISAQSLISARRTRQISTRKSISQAKDGALKTRRPIKKRGKTIYTIGAIGVIVVVAIAAVLFLPNPLDQSSAVVSTSVKNTSGGCELQPERQDKAAEFMADGAIIAIERNGGSTCIDEIFAVYPDGRIIGDNGVTTIEEQKTAADVEELLAKIEGKGWFTDAMYSTYHIPCGQCYVYYISVVHLGMEKTIKAVDGGTDAPADYWQVVKYINGLIPEFPAAK